MTIPMAVPMAMQRVEVITGRECRRRFSEAEKLRLVEEAFEPGAVTSVIARQRGVDLSLLYRWRQQLVGRQSRLPAFTPVTVVMGDEAPAEPCPLPAAPSAGTLEIEFPAGARLRITGPVDPVMAAAVVSALAGRPS
jgi:transposase